MRHEQTEHDHAAGIDGDSATDDIRAGTYIIGCQQVFSADNNVVITRMEDMGGAEWSRPVKLTEARLGPGHGPGADPAADPPPPTLCYYTCVLRAASALD